MTPKDSKEKNNNKVIKFQKKIYGRLYDLIKVIKFLIKIYGRLYGLIKVIKSLKEKKNIRKIIWSLILVFFITSLLAICLVLISKIPKDKKENTVNDLTISLIDKDNLSDRL